MVPGAEEWFGTVPLCNVEDSVLDRCLSAPQWFHVYVNVVWEE